jgi:hypothetical protein
MKIVVAGTGFSSILCINYLVNLGLKPVVLDVGNEIGEKEKIILKKKALARQKNLDNFRTLGGLSSVWTGVINKYLDDDFTDWPINKNEFNNYYDEVFENLNNSETYSFYSSSKDDLLNYQLRAQENTLKNEIYNNKKISIKYVSLLLNKLDISKKKINNYSGFHAFKIKGIVQDFIKKSKIEYRKEKIMKLWENNNQVTIETVDITNKRKKVVCDYLFLGCGTISTYLVMKNSIANFDKSLKIKTTKQIVMPVKFKNLMDFKNKFFNAFPIFQMNVEKFGNCSIYTQISNLNTTIVNYFFPKLKNFKRYYFFLQLFKNYGLSYSNLGNNFCDQFIIDDQNNLKVYETKYKMSEILNIYQNLFDKNLLNGQFFHYKIPIKMKPLSGNYFGSVFPMSKFKKSFFNSDRFGRIGNFKKISITDSSIFTKLSAMPPTLTILANSLRITKEVHKLNFFN